MALLSKLLRGLEKFIYDSADRIIAVFPDIKYVIGLGIEEEKIVHIPNGANPDIYSLRGIENPEFKEFLYNNPEIMDKAIFKVVYTGAHGVINDLGILSKEQEIFEA